MDTETAKQELLSAKNMCSAALGAIEIGDTTGANKLIDRALSYLADAKNALK